MTRDDIIRMAREVGYGWSMTDMHAPALERVALVAAAEREACIKILEAYQIPVGNSPAGELARDWTYDALKQIRQEIRERGVVIRERTYTDGENMVLSAVIAPSTP